VIEGVQAVIDNLKVNYKVSGSGRDVVLLHGWGGQLGSMAPIHRDMERYFRVYSLDLPGFGKSDPPPEAWGSVDYKELVGKFLDAMGITEPILIGHSFGGKISILLAAERKIRKLILIDSAGIRSQRSLRYYVKVYSYKLVKRILGLPVVNKYFAATVERFKNRMGSADYRNASGVMRQILVKAVNEDVRDVLPRITAPTLLVWGDNDTATSLADGRLMESLIPDAGLVVLKNTGHFSYLEKLDAFLIILKEFLKEDAKDGQNIQNIKDANPIQKEERDVGSNRA